MRIKRERESLWTALKNDGVRICQVILLSVFSAFCDLGSLSIVLELLPLSLRLEVGDSYELRSIERIFSRLSPSFQRLIAMLHCMVNSHPLFKGDSSPTYSLSFLEVGSLLA